MMPAAITNQPGPLPTEPDTTTNDIADILGFVPMDVEYDSVGTCLVTCTWAQADEYRGLGNGGWTIESDGRGRLDIRVTIKASQFPNHPGFPLGVERFVLNAFTRAPIKVSGEGY